MLDGKRRRRRNSWFEGRKLSFSKQFVQHQSVRFICYWMVFLYAKKEESIPDNHPQLNFAWNKGTPSVFSPEDDLYIILHEREPILGKQIRWLRLSRRGSAAMETNCWVSKIIVCTKQFIRSTQRSTVFPFMNRIALRLSSPSFLNRRSKKTVAFPGSSGYIIFRASDCGPWD